MHGQKIVYVDGVFDLFHEGHIEFLKKASVFGYLIVGVHSDAFTRSYKRQPVIREETRYRVVDACRYVDKMIPGAGIVTNELIDEYAIDLVIHGDDLSWNDTFKYYKCALLRGVFRHIAYTEGVSTSSVIRDIEKRLTPGLSV